jgi:hypothetical protein
LRGNREFRARETEWKSLLSDITDALQAAMLSVALTALNTARKEATKPYMKVKLLAGLKQLTIDNPVRTETFDKLEAKIQQRGHGSFGIAGPRGVGKTTLIGFFAKSSPGRLGVIVPAPVSYEARDFVLHLYSKLCKEAAKEAAKTLDKNKAWPTPDEGWPREQAESPSSVREIGIAVFGSSAVTGGIFLLTWAIVQRFSSFAPRLSDVGAALLAAAASILLVLLLRNLHVFNAVRFARPVIKAFGAEPPLNRERFLVEQPYSKPHDQGPLVRKRRIFIWVCVAVSALATMGIMLIVTNHGWGSSSRTLAGGLGLALLATGIPALAFLINAARPVKVGSASVPSPSPANDDTSSGDRELYEAAYSHLEWIQFQHSFGGEQSSTVKISGPSIIPLGMDIGGKRSADLTQQPSSYPEIVDDLRGFLSIAAKTRQVVIGVDELDKMRTPEDVQSFLNNIKGIFVAADCFYLVSISEDAAANFERRGSPFRDAFDSAFDEVISLEYFDMTDARKILYGLLFGWTEPFVGLCYVLSGGLVRDLLRCVYELVGYRNKDDVIELSDAALALCRREVSGRVQAIRYQLVCDPFAANVELLERIADLHPEEASARAFLTWHNDFLNGVNKTVSEDVSLSLSDIAPADGAESMADTRQAATEYPMASKPGMPGQNATRLALELTASLLFAATVLEFFDPAKISERLEDSGTMSPGPKSLATLAAARQALAQSPSVSLMLIERFRSAWKLGHLEGADAP